MSNISRGPLGQVRVRLREADERISSIRFGVGGGILAAFHRGSAKDKAVSPRAGRSKARRGHARRPTPG